MMNEPVYVTRPSLAPLQEFIPYLERIWESGIMTHNGPLLQRLEGDLSSYLGVSDTVCVSNGTSAMQLAIRALDLEGEIITTPFTFIATASAITWERCTPVFVDIDPETWNMDPALIEDAITEKTVAILPVHVFSAPCDVVGIQRVADQHGLKVIYDAAHAMCVEVDGKSIMSYGDIACTSFHATKLFNTCEGGACFSRDPRLLARIRCMRFFGFSPEKDVVDDGMNAKMTEMSAALGLANLPHLDDVRQDRRRKTMLYREVIGADAGVRFQKYTESEYNFSYMPVLLESEERLREVVGCLAEQSIHPRRYFYPALHRMEVFGRQELAVAQDVASRILCLPLFCGMEEGLIEKIGTAVRSRRGQ